jgi:hypothetical protein
MPRDAKGSSRVKGCTGTKGCQESSAIHMIILKGAKESSGVPMGNQGFLRDENGYKGCPVNLNVYSEIHKGTKISSGVQ